MVFWDAEFDGWRTTECGLFHCIYHTREEAEKKEQEIKHMEIKAIKEKMKTSDYAFLFENKNLQNNIVLLGLGGSYAYGTNIKSSDIDIRGIATRAKQDILIGNDFEQVIDIKTDTTIYSLRKTLNFFVQVILM